MIIFSVQIMSFLRAKSRAINKTVYFDNRTYGFLKLPIRTGNLYVEKNETVRRDLDVGGNLTIANDLFIGGNLDVKKNQTVGLDLAVAGNLAVANDQTIALDLAVGGNLAVANDQTIADDLTVGGDLAVANDQTVGRDLTVVRNLAVGNDQTIGNDLAVGNDQTVGRDLTVERNLIIDGDTTAANVYATQFYLRGLLNNYLLIPYGTIIQSAAVTVPDGWLLCDGASILKATYLNLFNAIGYVYGGSALNFNVPDMRGRVAVGTGDGDGAGTEKTNRVLGTFGGEETHTLSVAEMPSHSHTSNSTIDSTGGYGLIYYDTHSTQHAEVNDGVEPNLYQTPIALAINDTGSDTPHNNMQPFLVLNYLIKY